VYGVGEQSSITMIGANLDGMNRILRNHAAESSTSRYLATGSLETIPLFVTILN